MRSHRATIAVAVLHLTLGAGLLMPNAFGAGKGDDPKEALQELQDFIGGWKGTVDMKKKVESGPQFWKENANWSWRFKGKDVWLSVDMPESKLFKSGEMRFISASGKYQLTITDKKDQKAAYLGDMKKGVLLLERVHPTTNDVEQIKMNTVAGGVRLVQIFSVKPAERTLFTAQYQISYTKEGESFGVAAGKKGPECVVTGGLGTMAVNFNGNTYYVCCTGCRDAFNENPAKIIAEYKARKAKGD